MVIALTPFECMCGFRKLSEIADNFKEYPEFRTVVDHQGIVWYGVIYLLFYNIMFYRYKNSMFPSVTGIDLQYYNYFILKYVDIYLIYSFYAIYTTVRSYLIYLDIIVIIIIIILSRCCFYSNYG